MRSAFVTGATGLLGNNLTRALLERGVHVKALVRDLEKGQRQFGALPGLELVQGDMMRVQDFESALKGVDVLFHTAAYFRDSFKGGEHWAKLKRVNVDGTRELLEAASRQGLTRIIHTSSIAVLNGPRGATIDETMTRHTQDADDYFRSKILSDEVVFAHLARHPEMNISLVLPGWMHGPGDMGPTSAGQFTLDFINQALPGIPPATFAYVDARDVAQAMIAAVDKGRRGERYLAAGRHLPMQELMAHMERATHIPAPKLRLPQLAITLIATAYELWARITGKEVLLSLTAARNMSRERDRTRFDHTKSTRELGLTFRPIEDTIRDEVQWFQAHGMLKDAALKRLEA